MPTSEERREIANGLRRLVGLDYCKDPRYAVELASDAVCADHFHGGYGWDKLTKRLADLIEPEPERTCHVVPMDAAGNPPYRKGNLVLNALSDGCSACGYPFDTMNNGVPKYCKNCGAKVVGDD